MYPFAIYISHSSKTWSMTNVFGVAMGNNKGFITSHTTFVSNLEFTKMVLAMLSIKLASCFGASSPSIPNAILEGSNSWGGPTFSRDFVKVVVL